LVVLRPLSDGPGQLLLGIKCRTSDQYRYDAWGKPTGTGNVSTGVWSKSTSLISLQVATDLATRQPLRYAGYAFDQESALYYLSSRSYDPVTRQFLSKDLSRNDGEESAYQYCRGNPIGFVDPTGYRMDEFATSQERQAADISRARIKKAQRTSRARTQYRRMNPGERGSAASQTMARTPRPTVDFMRDHGAEVDAKPMRGDSHVAIVVDYVFGNGGLVLNSHADTGFNWNEDDVNPFLGGSAGTGGISLLIGSGIIEDERWNTFGSATIMCGTVAGQTRKGFLPAGPPDVGISWPPWGVTWGASYTY